MRLLWRTVIIGISHRQIFLKDSLLVDSRISHSCSHFGKILFTLGVTLVHYLAKRRAFCKICFSVEMFVYLYIYIFVYIFVCIFVYIFVYIFIFLLQFFQISTRSVDHSFSAIVLKLDRYTRERNSVRRTKFRRSRSKVKVTRRSNIKINETLSFWVNFIGSSPNLVDI